MNFVDIIRKKRDGFELSKEEIEYFAFSAADGSVPDYQLSLAIGKEGQNVRLAARLTGIKIDINAEGLEKVRPAVQ